MTPLQIEAHQKHVRFHAQIAYRAKLVGMPAVVEKELLPGADQPFWHCMWFADLIAIRPPAPAHLTVEFIQKAVARYFGLSKLDLISQRRTANVVLPRQIGMYLAKTMTTRSYPEIGRRFGGRDHTTTIYAVQKINARCASDPEFAAVIRTIKQEIGA